MRSGPRMSTLEARLHNGKEAAMGRSRSCAIWAEEKPEDRRSFSLS